MVSFFGFLYVSFRLVEFGSFEASNVMDGEESSGDHQMGCFQPFFVCKFFFTIQKGTTIFKQNGGCKDFQRCSLNFAKLKLVQKPVNFLFTISPNKIQRCFFFCVPVVNPVTAWGNLHGCLAEKEPPWWTKRFFLWMSLHCRLRKLSPAEN